MFSIRETEIIKIIGRKQKMTIRDITGELFMHVHPSDRPFDEEISTNNSIGKIIAKCKHHNLQWTLAKVRNGKRLIIRKVKL